MKTSNNTQSTLAGKVILLITGIVCLLYSYGFCKAIYDVNTGVTYLGAHFMVQMLDPISAQGYKAGIGMYVNNSKG
jgi:hypothetical protein